MMEAQALPELGRLPQILIFEGDNGEERFIHPVNATAEQFRAAARFSRKAAAMTPEDRAETCAAEDPERESEIADLCDLAADHLDAGAKLVLRNQG